MAKVKGTAQAVLTHLTAPATRPPSLQVPDQPPRPELALTGLPLIKQIADSIENGQSVLLTGPRGCGKSYCIKDAIRMWKADAPKLRDVIKLQGNREVGRDFLMESSISFFVYERERQLKVMPRPSPAPILKFAEMENDFTLRPLFHPVGDGTEKEVRFGPLSEYQSEGGTAPAPQDRFRHKVTPDPAFHLVLFLDEINRFPDGVLDSLLSIIEEREVYFEGVAIQVPVTVLMTMNPPGYDATARQLSPPLMARIGRSWKMASPDIDAMSDTIVADKNEVREIEIDPLLTRKACLASLCLWGDPAVARGTDYLTAESLALLSRVMQKDEMNLAPAMRTLASLSRYGPDGRAAAEWIRSAAAQAGKSTLDISHLEDTALSTLSHRIYDNFSSSSAPEKTAAKEEAIMVIVRTILRYDDIAEEVGVLRILDDATGERLKRSLVNAPPGPAIESDPARAVALPPSTRLRASLVKIGQAFHLRQKGKPRRVGGPTPRQEFWDWGMGNWGGRPTPRPASTAGTTAPEPRPAPRNPSGSLRALLGPLKAAGVKTDAQVRRYAGMRWTWAESRVLDASGAADLLRSRGYLLAEFTGDEKRKTTVTPRRFPDDLCYYQIFQKLELDEGERDGAATALPSVWDDAVELSGVRRFLEVATRGTPPAPATQSEDAARAKGKLAYQLKARLDRPVDEKEADVPSRRVHHYVVALWLHGLSRMARGNQFTGNEAAVQATLNSLRRRIVQEAEQYLDRYNKKTPAPFSGITASPDEEAAAEKFSSEQKAEYETGKRKAGEQKVLSLRDWLLRHEIFQDRAFLLAFLGILPAELTKLIKPPVAGN